MLQEEIGDDWHGEKGVPASVKRAVLRGIQQDGCITPATEAKVQRAVDLLRLEKSGPETLGEIEAISCTLRRMHSFLLEGRVNAYASALLRLRRSIEAL